MYHVICCNGYHYVDSAFTEKEALRIAREHLCGDYVCIIKDSSGRTIGDSVDGITGPIFEGSLNDHATATGMYDRY